MKPVGVGLLVLAAVLTSTRLVDDTVVMRLTSWGLTLAVLWLLIQWTRRRRRSTPTRYGAVQFRSRTEAAWAERFDREGRGWSYEAQWFKLQRKGRRMGYLPDFKKDDGSFIEIKGRPPTEEESRECQQVANVTGLAVTLLAGWPEHHTSYRFEPEDARQRWIA